MPEGLAASMTAAERRDLVRFLLDLGRPGQAAAGQLLAHSHTPATFPYDRAPLRPGRSGRTGSTRSTATASMTSTPRRPSTSRSSRRVPALLPPYPGPRRRDARPLGQPERRDLGRRPLEPDRPGHAALRRLPRRGRDRAQGGLRPARRSRRAVRLLQPRDALLRGRLDRRLRQVRSQAPRLPRRPHPRRHPAAAPRGQEARSPVRLPRVLPARQPGRLLVPDRRRRDARRPLGRRTASSPASSPRPRSIRSAI